MKFNNQGIQGWAITLRTGPPQSGSLDWKVIRLDEENNEACIQVGYTNPVASIAATAWFSASHLNRGVHGLQTLISGRGTDCAFGGSECNMDIHFYKLPEDTEGNIYFDLTFKALSPFDNDIVNKGLASETSGSAYGVRCGENLSDLVAILEEVAASLK